jgi:signal transduction histidine kinase
MAVTSIEPNPVADRVLAAAFAILTQTEVWVFTADDGYTVGLRLAASLLTFAASAALVFRRTHPFVSFLVNGLAVIVVIAVGYPSDIYQWTNLVATYSIGAHGTDWQRWAALPLAVGGPLFYFFRFPAEGGLALAAFAAAMWAVAWLAGRMYGARLEEIQLRHERDLSRRLAEANHERLALEEERNRIARELHDIVGHTVNVMVVHAGAGRREIERDSEAVARAFDTIAQTGRAALAELDRVLAVLRRDEGERGLSPTPGMADIDNLVGTFSETGLKVDLTVTGAKESVPASVGLSTYRIVQEALTNTLKHGGAGQARVAVGIGPESLTVEVSDDGHGDPGAMVPGRGILGMRERAAMHDGSVSFTRNDAGWLTVTASLAWETE